MYRTDKIIRSRREAEAQVCQELEISRHATPLAQPM